MLNSHKERTYLSSNGMDKIEGKVILNKGKIIPINYLFVKSYGEPTSFISMVNVMFLNMDLCIIDYLVKNLYLRKTYMKN